VLYNPYCIVNYFHLETTGKNLPCAKCIFEDCKCKQVRSTKEEKK
jgi:hypothetical protein